MGPVRTRLAAALDRIERDDPILRAFIATTGSRALARAAELDTGAEPPGELQGVIAGLKDNIDLHGVPCTAGSRHFRDRIPSTDATVSALLRTAGAVIVGKTNLAEFAMGPTGLNAAFGPCRNRWDPARVPGGSSAGSAVAVAAGFSDIALGTDTGGSVRIPASVNGVTGLRPTIGRVSTRGVLPVSVSYDTVGPIAPDVRTVARALATLDVYDDLDPAAVRGERTDVLAGLNRDPGGLRVGVPTDEFFADVDPGVHQVVLRAIDTLSELATISRVQIPDADQAQAQMIKVMYPEAAAVHRERLARTPGVIDPEVLRRLRIGLTISADDRAAALGWRARFQRRLDGVFENVDVIAAPTVPVDVPLIEGVDRAAAVRDLARLTYIWSQYGGPSISVPCGLHPTSGMPVGLQLSAVPWREDLLIQVAAAYERARGPVGRPPGLAALG